MFVRNVWYVAAWSREVGRHLLARTILNEPVVMYRKYDGTPVALRDACPHRFAPLSLGKLRGETVECGYHGLTYDCTGACVKNPVDGFIPKKAVVKSYPIVDRHNQLWIWMGNPERADESLIPDFHVYDDPSYAAQGYYLPVKAGYQLLADNLLDLSHIGFIHHDVFQVPEGARVESAGTEVTDRSVVDKRTIKDAAAVPAWKMAFNDFDGKCDLWMDMRWSAPSCLLLDVGVTPTGCPRDDGIAVLGLNNLTPETATTTHYFWGHARKYRIKEESVSTFWEMAMTHAFAQDKRVIEAQQAAIKAGDLMDLDPILLKGDAAAIQARRIVKRMIDDELSELGAHP